MSQEGTVPANFERYLINSVPENKKRRLLIVWRPEAILTGHIAELAVGMQAWFAIWAIPTTDPMAPDIRIFDLDGLPAPNDGLIQQLLAQIMESVKGQPVV